MITIAHTQPVNSTEFAALAEEMDRFYGATEIEPLELRVRQINDAVFSDPPSAYSLLAWDDGKLVGFASYSFLWPAVGLTRSVYLKEMYVIEAARRTGAGKLLVQRLCDIAVENNCTRVEWTTDRDNLEARRFYAELDVPIKESKVFYRIEGDGLHQKAAHR
jgi:GNAT superfamily N-acetyltransferase